MAIVNKGFPTDGVNGTVSVGRDITPYSEKTHTESRSILKAFGSDPMRVNLGLLSRWNQFNLIRTPLLNWVSLEQNVIHTPYQGAFIDYFVAFKKGCPVIKEVLDTESDKPGLGQSEVAIVLTDQYAKGDVLGLGRLRDSPQVRVSTTKEVEEGYGGYIHWVTEASGDPTRYIPREALSVGTELWKITSPYGEFDKDASTITGKRDGLMKYSYETGSSEIRVKHSITTMADQIDIQSAYSQSNMSLLQGYKDQIRRNLNGVTNFTTYDVGDKKVISHGWMPTIIELIQLELQELKGRQAIWSEGYEYRDARGKRFKVPKGYYPWIRDYGIHETYSSFSQLIPTMQNLMSYMFAGRPDVQAQDRRVRWRMGTGAMVEFQKQFMTYFTVSNPFLFVNDGKNPQLNGMISGTYDALKFRQPRFVSFQFPNMGIVEVEHEPALDYLDGDAREQGYIGELPRSSYMIFVEDITAESVSNAMPKGPNVKRLGTDIGDNGANVVRIQPKGFAPSVNYIAGIGASPTLNRMIGQNYNSIQAASSDPGFTVIAIDQIELFIKDATRIALVEYKPNNSFF